MNVADDPTYKNECESFIKNRCNRKTQGLKNKRQALITKTKSKIIQNAGNRKATEAGNNRMATKRQAKETPRKRYTNKTTGN